MKKLKLRKLYGKIFKRHGNHWSNLVSKYDLVMTDGYLLFFG